MALILPGNVASATAATGFDVDNSCNFELGSLHKSVSSPSATFTISVWVKLSNQYVATSSIGQRYFWTGGGAGGASGAKWNDGNVGILDFYNEGTGHINDGTGRNYRDPSAWYHWVWKNASGTGTLYINGVQQGTTFSMGPLIGSGGPDVINIGRYGADTVYAPMTLAEFVYLDATAATPTSFGEYDSDSPTIWKPIDVSGLTFGTNGFYLDFETAGTLGNDANGGTDLTTTGTLVQHSDTPTNNFATLNPLNVPTSDAPAFSKSNLKSISANAKFGGSSTIGLTSGKWFLEAKSIEDSTIRNCIGITGEASELARQNIPPVESGVLSSVAYNAENGNKYINATSSSYGADYGNDDIIGIAIDLDSGTKTVTFYKNGASQGAITIPTAVGSTADGAYFICLGSAGASPGTFEFNFGSPPYAISSGNTDDNGYGNFEYAPPSGFLAMCTKNLGSDGG